MIGFQRSVFRGAVRRGAVRRFNSPRSNGVVLDRACRTISYIMQIKDSKF